jgi:DNA primase
MIRRTVGRCDTTTIEGRTQAVDEALPLVARLRDPVRRQQYAHLLSDLAGVEEDSVRSKLGRTSGPAPPSPSGTGGSVRTPAPNAPPTPTQGGARRKGTVQERVEWEMLKVLARDQEAFDALSGQLTEEHFESARNRELFDAIVSAGGDLRSLVADPEQERLAARLSELAVEPLEGEPGEGYAHSVYIRLEELRLQRRSGDVRRRLQQLNPTTDPGYDDLFQQLIAIDGELRRLRDRVLAEG